MFEHVDAYAGDPILTLVETFHKDTREQIGRASCRERV